MNLIEQLRELRDVNELDEIKTAVERLEAALQEIQCRNRTDWQRTWIEEIIKEALSPTQEVDDE